MVNYKLLLGYGDFAESSGQSGAVVSGGLLQLSYLTEEIDSIGKWRAFRNDFINYFRDGSLSASRGFGLLPGFFFLHLLKTPLKCGWIIVNIVL